METLSSLYINKLYSALKNQTGVIALFPFNSITLTTSKVFKVTGSNPSATSYYYFFYYELDWSYEDNISPNSEEIEMCC